MKIKKAEQDKIIKGIFTELDKIIYNLQEKQPYEWVVVVAYKDDALHYYRTTLPNAVAVVGAIEWLKKFVIDE